MEWIPAIVTTSGFSAILWFLRKVISERLNKAITHEYDRKIEDLRADLRKNEEHLKANLIAKESQIESLRTTVLANLTRRQDLVFEKKIIAIDQLWESVMSLAKGKATAVSMAIIKFAPALEEAEKNPEMREFAEVIGSGIDIKNFDTQLAQKARPFVSLLAWAYFSAYQAIIFHALTKLHLLKAGINKPNIIDNENIVKLVKTALPHHRDYIDQHGPDAFHFFLEELESSMLAAFRLMLKGEELDQATIEMATSIIKQAGELVADKQSDGP